ncbi:MAG: TolC family protein [Thermodesulfobacteriota bacterium]|nr:TolC family protein [Candidatus Dadabacteria bacterium]MCZ6639822.1 TolC family protein [Candidatus Dadabacteria bacterium]
MSLAKRKLYYLSTTVLILILCSLYPDTALNQEVIIEDAPLLPLEEALIIAVVENPKIKNAFLEIQKSDDAVWAIKTKLFPELDFSLYEAYHLTDESFEFKKGAFGDISGIPIPAENTSIATTPDFTTFITASAAQPISQLYEISLLIKQREIQKALSDQELRARVLDITDEVKKEYYSILKSQSSLAAIDEKIVFLTSLLELVNRDVQQQRLLEKDSLEVQARLGRAEYKHFKLKNTLATQKERFNKLLGRDIETPFSVIPIPYAAPFTVNVEDAEGQALAQRPEIDAAELEIEFAENEVRIKKSKYIPEIGVQFQYTANLNVELLPENIATIGLFAKWDVFDWGRKKSEVAEKKKSVIQAQNRLEETESQILIDVNSKIRKLEESAVLINVTELEQVAAKENLRVVLNKYKVEDALLTQVLEAESSLEEKNSDHQKAILDYWTARANLDKAIGEE